ncbi:MAG TPA: aminomethyltransferase family protein [Myxococcota bacterium]|nr:aminomethyltransferase family protein [Myxococcota bacterium]
MPRQTPFHARTNALCESQTWIEWSGYLSAQTYEMDHIHEYNAIRLGAGLFDISPLYKYLIHGRDAVALINRVITRDASKCRVGQVLYTAWCDDAGKIIDDGTVARLGDDRFRMTAATPTLYWLQDNAFGMDVEIEDVTDAYGALALQGPVSRDILLKLAGAELGSLGYFHLVDAKLAGSPVTISRTGYTGDLGYEIFAAPEHCEKIWDALMVTGADHKMQPTGMIALDMARIEAGLLLLDADFHSAAKAMFEVEKTSPLELGLGWMVNLKKDYFIGKDALEREQARGPASCTVGLEIDVLALEKVFAEHSMPLHLPYSSWVDAIPVYADGDQRDHIGRATSGTWSPVLKKYVVIGRVKPQYAKLGTRIYVEQTVEARRYAVPATVVKMPFFDPPRKRE